MVSVACFGVRVSVMFHLMFIILLVRFGLLSGHLLGNSCPLGWPHVLIVFCLFVIFIYFPFWFLAFNCSSSCPLLFYYFFLMQIVAIAIKNFVSSVVDPRL